MHTNHKNQQGFTLTELSIVIIIIGLIVGGVLAGQNLIKNSQLQSVLKDVQRYETAIENFQFQYNDLPGDISNATTHWPGAGVTANGDGDGRIEAVVESYRAWQHLSLAGLIEGNYLGTRVDAAPIVGSDVPIADVNGGYYLDYGTTANPVVGFANQNVLVLGGVGNLAGVASPILPTAVLSAEDALSIEIKLGDSDGSQGNNAPTTGFVRAIEGNGTAAELCVNAAGDYNVPSDDSLVCILGFPID